MTREKQMEQAAINYAQRQDDDLVYGERDAFVAGAKWADRTMIERACEWIRDELNKEEELHYIHVHGFDCERRNEFIERFKQAME